MVLHKVKHWQNWKVQGCFMQFLHLIFVKKLQGASPPLTPTGAVAPWTPTGGRRRPPGPHFSADFSILNSHAWSWGSHHSGKWQTLTFGLCLSVLRWKFCVVCCLLFLSESRWRECIYGIVCVVPNTIKTSRLCPVAVVLVIAVFVFWKESLERACVRGWMCPILISCFCLHAFSFEKKEWGGRSRLSLITSLLQLETTQSSFTLIHSNTKICLKLRFCVQGEVGKGNALYSVKIAQVSVLNAQMFLKQLLYRLVHTLHNCSAGTYVVFAKIEVSLYTAV